MSTTNVPAHSHRHWTLFCGVIMCVNTCWMSSEATIATRGAPVNTLQGQPTRCVVVASTPNCTHCELAGRELRRYFRHTTGQSIALNVVHDAQFSFVSSHSCAGASHVLVVGICDTVAPLLAPAALATLSQHIHTASSTSSPLSTSSTDLHFHGQATLTGFISAQVTCGVSSIATLYSAYAYAEKQLGVRFYPHGDVLPLAGSMSAVSLPQLKSDGEVFEPQFVVRGANTWGTWTEGFDWWTSDNWRGFIAQLTKMRMNFIGMHSYPSYLGEVEPSVWIGTREQLNPQSLADVLPLESYPSSYTTTLKGRGGYVPKPTSSYSGGASGVFPDDCCCGVNIGAPPSGSCPEPQTPEANVQVLSSARDVFTSAFAWAATLGVETALGTESPIPQAQGNKNMSARLYEGIFTRMNASFGSNLTYYWIWTPEGYEWSHPTAGSVQWTQARDDMLAAHTVWSDPAAKWGFKLATAGWTLGPMENPAWLDQQLPTDFSALSGLVGRVGRDAVQPGYANCTRHPTWVMPWMESDDALGWVEIWVNRSIEQANVAHTYGAQGLIGLQWRTEEVAPQLSALAQRAWDSNLTSAKFWLDFSTTNFSPNNTALAAEMAVLLQTIDGDADSVNGAALPFFTSCCPGHIRSAPPAAFCLALNTSFAFTTKWSSFASRIVDVGSLARHRKWNSTFGYFFAGARAACLLRTYDAAITAAAGNVDKLKATAVPIRAEMVREWEELMARLLETVGSRGAMGTLQNMEAITRPLLLDSPGVALSKAIGENVLQPTLTYTGHPRVFQLNTRSVYSLEERFYIEVATLGPDDANLTVTLWFRTVPNPTHVGSVDGVVDGVGDGVGDGVVDGVDVGVGDGGDGVGDGVVDGVRDGVVDEQRNPQDAARSVRGDVINNNNNNNNTTNNNNNNSSNANNINNNNNTENNTTATATNGWSAIVLDRNTPGRTLFNKYTGPMVYDFDYYLEALWSDGTVARFPEAAPTEYLAAIIN